MTRAPALPRFDRARRLSPLALLQIALTALLALALTAHLARAAEPQAARVVAIGGSITEIVYALDQQHRLVARDTTSSYPPAARDLPDVGYMRALSPEGLLSVRPDLVIAVEGAGPPAALEVLRAAQIPFVEVPEAFDGPGIGAKIRAVGQALGVSERAAALAAEVEDRVAHATAQARARAAPDPLRVMFVLSIQGGRILAAGSGTEAEAIIRMAGGENALSGFAGYKPVADEAISRAAPDVILVMDREGPTAITDAALFALPALAVTPAAATRRVVRMNGLHLLGFGPRTAEAVRALNRALYDGGA